MNNKFNTLEIRTPDGISFSLLLASPVTRFLAWCVDVAIIIVMVILLFLTALEFNWINPDLVWAMFLLGFFVISIGYGIFLEWLLRGQTIGKKLLRLRVMDERGLQLRLSQVIIRNLLRFIDSQPLFFYMLGGITCLLNPRAQRLGDFAANTIVVRNPRVAEPDIEQLALGKFNSFRRYPHLEARLRQQITRDEAALALDAVLRREDFEPEARVKLFDELADYFRGIVDFPEAVSRDISSEQYLRNMVDSLYRQPGKGLASNAA